MRCFPERDQSNQSTVLYARDVFGPGKLGLGPSDRFSNHVTGPHLAHVGEGPSEARGMLRRGTRSGFVPGG